MSQTPNTAVAVIGIDIGKNSFHVVGHDARGVFLQRTAGPYIGSIATALAEQKFQRCPLCPGSGSQQAHAFCYASPLASIRQCNGAARQNATSRGSYGPLGVRHAWEEIITSEPLQQIPERRHGPDRQQALQRLQESAGSTSLHELGRQPRSTQTHPWTPLSHREAS